ncbi:MAG TPA: ATP-binding protein [Bdellovibrionota bacterium]|nr:ATP-binding protein [Bdellovibrionota bacterium]
MPDPERRFKICLTGGPGAGKTAVAQLMKRQFGDFVYVVPESATILYSGGLSRARNIAEQFYVQRAIYELQRQQEEIADLRTQDESQAKLILCDRGTLDFAAYWDGSPEEFLFDASSSLEAELARYDLLIHMETPTGGDYQLDARVRVEDVEKALELDHRIAEAWVRHPRRHFVKSRSSFIEKVEEVISIINESVRLYSSNEQVISRDS